MATRCEASKQAVGTATPGSLARGGRRRVQAGGCRGRLRRRRLWSGGGGRAAGATSDSMVGIGRGRRESVAAGLGGNNQQAKFDVTSSRAGPSYVVHFQSFRESISLAHDIRKHRG
jgi:hypothetical protein